MAFKPFGDTEPESITYNGNEVKVVSYNGTYVWGKPYTSSLTKTTGSGASAGVAYILRKTSQYEHASTSLSTQIPIIGTKNIYYGDSIAVHFTCPEGSVISSATVTNNGQSVQVITSDRQNRNTAFFTVNGDVSCTLATAAPSWNTIWTGTVNGLIKGTNRTLTMTASGAFTTGSDYRVTIGETLYNIGGGSSIVEASSMPTTYSVQIGKIATLESLTVNSSTITLTINTGTATFGNFQMTKVEAYY